LEKASQRDFSWIKETTLSVGAEFDARVGITVAQCLPSSYPAYLKILHPIYIDLQTSDLEMTWDEWDKTGLGKAHFAYREATPEMLDMSEAVLVSSPYIEPVDHTVRVRWREIADRYGLFFNQNFNAESFRAAFAKSWPRHLLGPAEGFLELGQYSTLLSTLSAFTEPQFIYLKMPDMWKVGDDVNRLIRGDVSEVMGFLREQASLQSPEYLWPEDRSWCINSDYDLHFTLVAGSTQLMKEITRNEELEILVVFPDTRVDYCADRLNLRGTPAASS
jgi:hypothetical protein